MEESYNSSYLVLPLSPSITTKLGCTTGNTSRQTKENIRHFYFVTDFTNSTNVWLEKKSVKLY